MGLDVVDLVMEVERTFGIRLDDGELGCARTVGDLCDLVRRKGGRATDCDRAGSPAICLTLVSFVRLRRALMAHCQVARDQVRPQVEVRRLLGRKLSTATWGQLEHELALELPALRRPDWLRWLLALGWLLLGIAALVVAARVWNPAIALVTGAFVAGAFGISLWRLTMPLVTRLEREARTVGGLSKRIVTLNYRKLADEYPLPPAEDVLATLVGIISRNLCIPVEDISADSRFIEDLACD